jgi:hypothetical protein
MIVFSLLNKYGTILNGSMDSIVLPVFFYYLLPTKYSLPSCLLAPGATHRVTARAVWAGIARPNAMATDSNAETMDFLSEIRVHDCFFI